jgi:hypothetical protein
MLNNGAHVSIDGIPLMLARDPDGRLQYDETFESLFAPTSAIAGEIAKEQIRPEKLLWSITDWSGGEGNLIYYPQDPTTYDYGSLVNPSTRGMLTTRPKRYRSAVARSGSNATTEKRPAGVSSYGYALIAWEDNIISATDAAAWSAAQDTSPAFSGQHIGYAISDGTNAAFTYVGDISGVVECGTAVNAWSDTDSGTTMGSISPAACVVDGVPYTFTTLDATGVLTIFKKASGMATVGDWGATVIYSTGIVPVGVGGGGGGGGGGGATTVKYFIDAVGAETAAYFSYSTNSQSFVWEVRNDVGRPFWTGPPGFVIKKLVYHMGVLFCLGGQTSAGKTFGGVYAIPLVTRSPVFIAAPRMHKNTQLGTIDVGCPGPGSSIVFADSDSGKIFVYEMERDAVWLLDDLANGGSGDGMDFVASTDKIAFLAMHGSRLFGATWEPTTGAGTSLQVFSYDDFVVDNRDAGQAVTGYLETAEWDFGLPMERKALIGFYVNYKVTDATSTSGLLANSRIKVEYSMDDASYATAATMTSTTTPVGGKGRHFIQISDGTTTSKFTRLKVKITLDNNSQSVAPPVLYAVTVEAQPIAYARIWDLVIQVEDEESNERPASRQNSGYSLHTALTALATNKDLVPFLDGAWSPNPGVYDTHTVIVEDPRSSLSDRLANGTMRVRLRSVLS